MPHRAYTVVMLIDELELWRGTETHLLRLVERIDRARIRPVVAAVTAGSLGPAFEEVGASFHLLGIHRVLNPEGALGLLRVARLLREVRADLVVSYHTAADLLAPVAAFPLGVPVLSSRRDEGFTKKRVHKRIQRRLNRLLRGMVSVSHAVVRAVARDEGFPPERHQVIWNGEDLQRFAPGPSPLRGELGLSPDAPVVMCVGGLSPVKDHRTLIDAFAAVSPAHPDAVLVLVGKGPEEPALRERAAPLGDRVRFLGHRRDVPELLRGADIYAQTSTTEGFSNAILQGMATALPVVCTRVGGNPELVTEACGLLTEAGAVGGVARALSTLLADPNLRLRMGASARARAEAEGSIGVMTERYMDAFERAVEDRFPGPSSG